MMSALVVSKKETSKEEVGFHFVLLTVDGENAWLVIHEAVVGFVENNGWANEHDVIELALKGPRS